MWIFSAFVASLLSTNSAEALGGRLLQRSAMWCIILGGTTGLQRAGPLIHSHLLSGKHGSGRGGHFASPLFQDCSLAEVIAVLSNRGPDEFAGRIRRFAEDSPSESSSRVRMIVDDVERRALEPSP